MGRAPCCDKVGLKRGPWTCEEDQVLISFIQQYGHSNWRALPKQAGLLRCGKSCRLRWINYLKPDIKRGNFTKEEEDTIIQLHEMMGNRWSAIAARLPGRTDNEIKNVWHTHLKKRVDNHNQTPKLRGRMSKQHHDDTQNNEKNVTTHSNSTSTNNFSEITTEEPRNSSQQSCFSDDINSFTDVSSVEAPTNVPNSMDAQKYEANESEFDQFPIIDDTFWSSPELCYDSFSMDVVFPDATECHKANIVGTSKTNYCSPMYVENTSVNQGDIVDFWLDVLVNVGGVSELPEFGDFFVG
ncbi:hypothetical protein KSS87_018356 [Heliosperma pusillum]|nr:hypothetical protein KSS87_018356 [Heliosperma pusillum]